MINFIESLLHVKNQHIGAVIMIEGLGNYVDDIDNGFVGGGAL